MQCLFSMSKLGKIYELTSDFGYNKLGVQKVKKLHRDFFLA